MLKLTDSYQNYFIIIPTVIIIIIPTKFYDFHDHALYQQLSRPGKSEKDLLEYINTLSTAFVFY